MRCPKHDLSRIHCAHVEMVINNIFKQTLNIGYGTKIKKRETLNSLEWLQIANVKAKELIFLHEVINLEHLRIIGGSFYSITGIENCSKLKTLFLQKMHILNKVKTNY
jgi:hypothetical protein